ncbi:MerR family transcriptional regulator [Bacillus spongiae]|uniref:MerR family transcriptional regulator n=1 Tax=Bacillus spongiae TaxID=2683610 RepID=A0ABU8HGH6_9BACI
MYNIRIASEKVGVTPVTLRAWERRYGLAPSSRSEGGHRMYSNDDIRKLIWLKKQMNQKGISISKAVELLSKQEERMSVEQKMIQKDQEIIDPLFNALTSFELNQAHSIVDYSFSVYHFDRVFEKLFYPLATRIGNEWAVGNITVAQEHFASQFLLQRCFKIMDIFPIQPQLPKAIAFCPEGEHHHLGLTIFTLFLRKKGLCVLYLGPNTPEDGLDELIEEQQIQYVCLSITSSNDDKSLISFIEKLKNKHSSLQFILGGKGTQQLDKSDNYKVLDHKLESWEQWFQEDILPVS